MRRGFNFILRSRADELLARYSALLYRRLGTYAEVAKRTGLHPRTSRKYVQAAIGKET